MGGYKVPDEHKQIAYYYAKKVLSSKGDFTISDAVKATCKQCNINQSSADTFIRTIVKMLNGEAYGRGIGGLSTRFLFDHIYIDFGERMLNTALCSTIKHIIKYRELKENDTRTISQRQKEKYVEEQIVLEYAQKYQIDISDEHQELKDIIL